MFTRRSVQLSNTMGVAFRSQTRVRGHVLGKVYLNLGVIPRFELGGPHDWREVSEDLMRSCFMSTREPQGDTSLGTRGVRIARVS